jgi:two-component system, sensor histidine kinase and response regulator
MLMSKKILIVEDSYDFREILGKIFTSWEWQPIFGESDREALDKLERDTLSAILVNVQTPVMKGIKLAASLKAHPAYKNMPILAASGHSRGLTRERCLALGCDHFVALPLAFPEL